MSMTPNEMLDAMLVGETLVSTIDGTTAWYEPEDEECGPFVTMNEYGDIYRFEAWDSRHWKLKREDVG